ncbi:MAG: hypothetical protein KA239_05895 [Bacteroidia bacterium]|nr:hypothetical protein [Bacteroidia bacterium]
MAQDQNPVRSPKSLRWLQAEPIWLIGLGLVFHFLAQIHWDKVWEGFAYDPVLRWYVPGAFFIAALYSALNAVPEWQPTYRIRLKATLPIELALSFGAVLYLKYVDPMVYVDDAGFILRYFDHFAEGCFFCFNVDDGPVFGLSSFIYGLLGGFLTWSGIFNSEGAVNYLAYIGTFFTGFLYFRILRKLVSSAGMMVVFWFLLMTCSRSMAVIYNAGMEAPIHFSLILTALLFFLDKKERLMWLFLAISVISKLDAVPLVLVVGIFWTIENWSDLRAFDWHKKRYHDALKFGLVPVLVWIVFAWIVFGSPLPQSAFAKIYIHNHAKGSWFPFIEAFVANGYRSPFLVLSLGLFLAQLGWVAAKRQGGRGLFFGFAFVATLLLYYFYNPGERMVWYYVLPEGLMLLQLAVGLQWLFGSLKGNGRLLGVGGVIGCLLLFTSTFMVGDIAYTRNYEDVVEGERLRIGDYLAAHVTENQSLQSGHGLISRKVKGYVVDETGLNFRVDTTMKQRNKALWEKYRPDWVVMHGFSWEVDKLNSYPYVLDTSFFDIALYGYPAWRIFRRTATEEESEGTYYLQLSEILADQIEVYDEPQKFLHTKANAYTFVRSDFNKRESKLTMGLIRHEYPYRVHVKDVLAGDTTIWQHTYVVDSFAGPGTNRIMPLTIPLLRPDAPANPKPGLRYIILQFENSYGKVGLYDPAITVLRKDPF